MWFGSIRSGARAKSLALWQLEARGVVYGISLRLDRSIVMLNNLAFQAAVTKVCEGFDFDQSKFAKAITDATTPLPNPDMSEEDIKVWETAVIMRLGATYGVLLAEGNTRQEKFCASAKDLKADPSVPNVWQ